MCKLCGPRAEAGCPAYFSGRRVVPPVRSGGGYFDDIARWNRDPGIDRPVLEAKMIRRGCVMCQ